MEEDFSVSTPCSSIAVDSVLRMSSAGVIWGACFGPFDARRLGIFAAIFSFTHCGMQRYRRKKDWVNTLAAGVLAGAAFGAGTRNWKQVAGITGLFCTLFQFAQDSKSV
ncbi:outer envelope pore protein 16-4, chloroplastic isoform X4 [Sesamum indicum]|uniref:Outer envelope pore protein 16-4, chloroplastic isoform X4 n=1 Tax=Sesamum indicum TaxID=4182 RepID=A0A8M8UTF6_SESIN|nr:outer envelope pore protein 16-4, chloroplastic isoform X4 [Sesamum indicum]